VRQLLVLGLLLGFVACAQQQPPAATAPPPQVAVVPPPTPAPPPPPPSRTSFDGLYKGTMSQTASKQTTDALVGGGCDPDLPVSMRVKRGDIRIWYKNFVGHTLHYRGKIDATGKITAYHTNRGGDRAILGGQISGDTANLDLNRGRCYYTVALTKA
jgi:hypothetical protein